ncbi:diguanylate cyclase [Chitinibacter bivalviorum]|uniref:Diguanylate cyclase n=1 Tax=Chitinibacter bivalviorum TaxID=2739434 RepID=A0A7H9BLC7_9NEIS|nr:sensor domain-containing diguanylate cyclase [Chitinibacter bivalviorum]QLG89078.1 diguanylate cyclase [Chitinibacter bivalviorum]
MIAAKSGLLRAYFHDWPLLRVSAQLMLGYLLLALLSICLFRLGNGIAVIWFANAIGIVALSRLAYQRWLLPVLALAVANLGANLFTGTPLSLSLIYLLSNLLEMLLGGFLLRRSQGEAGYFFSLSGILRLFWLGVLLPVLAGSLLAVVLLSTQVTVASLWLVLLHWIEGSAIGGATILPLAYWICLYGWRSLLGILLQKRLFALLLLAVAVAILAPMALPFPFIYMSLPLFWIAYSGGVPGVVLVNMLVSMAICVQISLGLLLPPPTIYTWGYTLFYLPILATLLPPLMLATAMDMSSSAVAALEHSERRYRSLYQHTPAMLSSCDPSGHIVSVNEVWLRTTGFHYAEVIGQEASHFLSSESARQLQQEVWPILLREGVCHNIPQQINSKSGGVVEVLMTAALERNESGSPTRLLVVQLDISDKVKAQHQAYHDALTQLPNRMLFSDRLEQACQQGNRNHENFCVIFLDLDHFKTINDDYGHELGDQLLVEVSHRLSATIRSSDTVSRLGGDEFVMLLGGLAPCEEAAQIAAKILTAVAQPCTLNGVVITISVSMGLAFYPDDGLDSVTLMRHADEAMYRAKRLGRNCFAQYTPS